MAESVVLSVGQTIGKLLIDEAKFLWGVEGKVKDLQNELELIQGFLRDADARQEVEQAIRIWVAQLRDIAYDAEDVIEQYILRVAQKKGQNIIKAYACFVAKCTCLQVHGVETEIEGLKSSISNLRRSMQGHGIQYVNEGKRERARASTPRRTYAHFEEDIVGREDSIKVLVKELKDGNQHRVISIWGMGGLGKTTLTKKVFAHDEVKNNFDGFAWTCISQEYHVKDILMEILVKLIPDQRKDIKEMMDPQLFETLYKIQQEKRCIVVLDDIWTKEAWNSLRAAFPVENTRSKLLITTRNRDVAEYIDPQGLLHELRCLSDQESWDLLKKKAFIEMKEITEDMKSLGDKLLKKCGGLPLAVIVLGGLLVVNEWETVYRNINLHFSDKGDVSKVLALSYDDLPWHLKPCFLYLGNFPDDAEIPATKVLHMWIAEGFVLPDAYDEDRNITVENVAKQYLMELVKRGLVQVQPNSSGNIKTCRLHDLMRDLCVFKARQGRFLSFLNIQQGDEREDSSSVATEVESTCKTRRLSLNMHMIGEGNAIPRVEQIGRNMLHLRTLMFFHSGEFDAGMWRQFQPIFINCKFLRVLKLEDLSWMYEKLPESVGDLIHLRFLSLARSKFEGLPQSMGNLVCMEFLDLCTIRFVNVTIPNVLWKMRRLRYLRLPYQFTIKEEFHWNRKKLRLDTLKNLRRLKNFSPKECDVNDVGKLTNLQKLSVYTGYDSMELEIFPQLAKFTLQHLRYVSFYFATLNQFREGEWSKMSSYQYLYKLSMFGTIERLPEHKNLPQQLRKLVLFDSKLIEDPMPILKNLRHLVVLMLASDAFVGKKMVCSAGGFPQLKHLFLYDLPNLEEWRVDEGAMPHLSGVGINYCLKLKTLPEEVSHVYTYDGWDKIYHEYLKRSLML